MSWGTAWRNAWSGTWGDGISLTVAEAQHTETSDPCVLLQAYVLAVDNTSITADGALVTLDLIQANMLTLQDARNIHLVDVVPLSQVGSLSVYRSIHNHAVDNIGYFVVIELRLLGTLSSQSGVVNVAGVQCVVFSGSDLYPFKKWGATWGTSWGSSWGNNTLLLPFLRSSSITITDGQIAIQNSEFRYEHIGDHYLVIFYKPGSPRIGGGPYPARMVNVYA